MRRSLKRKIFFEPKYCLMCAACVLACQMRCLGVREVQEIPRTANPPNMLNLNCREGAVWIWSCRQCEQAPCTEACVSGCLRRNTDTDRLEYKAEACIGCGSCYLACPQGSARLPVENEPMPRCEPCWEEGTPPCVAACISGALLYQSPHEFAGTRRKNFIRNVSRHHD